MDPFSLAAGVAGLVALAYQMAQEVDRLRGEYKSVPDELDKLASQTQHITAALNDFKELFVKRVIEPQSEAKRDVNAAGSQERPRFMPNEKWLKNMEHLLTSLVETIQALKDIWQEASSKKNKMVRYWNWSSSKLKLGNLERDLDRNMQTLLVMMSTFTSMSDAYIREELHHISTQVSNPKPVEVVVPAPAPAPQSMFKIPSFGRSASSLPVLASFPSFSLFRTDSGKSEQSDNSEASESEPPPYAPLSSTRSQVTWLAGYYYHGEEKFCVVVRQPHRNMISCHSRDSADMQGKFNEAVTQGYRMRSINVHLAPDDGVHYCHTYVIPGTEREQIPWYAAWDLDIESFVTKNTEMTNAGYVCVHINACGRPKGGAIFAGVWEKHSSTMSLRSEVVHSVTLKELTSRYSNYCFDAVTGDDKLHRSTSGTCAYEDGTGYIKFATVFMHEAHRPQASQAQQTKYLLTKADLDKQMSEFQRQGFQAITINPFVLTGQELFNCTWQKGGTSDSDMAYTGLSKTGLEKVYEDVNST